MKIREMQERKGKHKRIALQISLNLAVIALILLVLNTSLLISPGNNMITRNNNVKFDWIGLHPAQLDENPEFTSPMEITKQQSAVELKPGRYYWKSGLGGTGSFVIESEVSLAVTEAELENETAYRIQNKGNTRVLLNLLGIVTGRVVLEPEAVTYEKNLTNIEKILAEENESR